LNSRVAKAKVPYNSRKWRIVPAMLIGLRVALGPLLYTASSSRAPGPCIATVLVVALLSDIFDGVIARKVGVATEKLRVSDSWADFWFYMWVCASVWVRDRDIIIAFRAPLLTLAAMDACSYGIDIIKYRRIASFHAYTAKLWGITLFIATVALLVFHTGGDYLWLAIIAGIVSNLDALIIKLLLPTWQHDIPSSWHAWRMIRKSP